MVDPEIECYSDLHNALMCAAAVGIVLFTAGYARSACGTSAQPGQAVRNAASCSFPLMTFIALYVIDQRQEHNSVLRFRQFGHLYDRCPVSLGGRQSRLIGWVAHSLSIGTSRTAHSFSRWSPSLGAVRRALMCVCSCVRVRGCSSLVR